MNNTEKAEIILKGLSEYVQIDSAFESYYVKGILKGLREIDDKLKGQDDEDTN